MTSKILPIKLSSRALDEIRNIIKNKKIPEGYHLRIGIKGGGCGGVSFLLGFDQLQAHDDFYEFEGLHILVDKRHLMYIIGKRIDYHQGTEAVGFVFLPTDGKD